MTIREIVAKVQVWGIAGVRNYLRDRVSLVISRAKLARMLAEDRRTVPQRGITVIADLSSGGSISKTTRDFIFSLKDAGIPWQSFDTRRLGKIAQSEYADMITPEAEFDIRKYDHIVEMFSSPLPKCPVKCRARIAFWEGEHGILDVWPFLDNGDPVIAMSDFNYAYFRRELLHSKACKILYPLRRITREPPPAAEVRKRFGIGLDDFVAFYNFDLGSFCRKNPKAVMEAFAKGLKLRKDARLVFKTMGASAHKDRVAELEACAAELGVSDRFVMITEYLPHELLYGLTAACDVYVSLHRGEGFGLGMAEAMLFGKPVIATGWSSNVEFCPPEGSFLVPYRMVPIKDGEFFASMKEWAEADVDVAAEALARCYSDRELCRTVGERGRKFVEERFSIANFRKSVEDFLDEPSFTC